MIKNKIQLEPNNATLTSYLHEDKEVRQAILLFPGGAYQYCSPGEGEPVALAYYNEGFNTFVLEYSCIQGIFGSPKKDKDEVFDSALEDGMNAFYYLQEHHEEFFIDKNKISIVGFSAGANLALATVNLGGIRPLSLILGYGAYSKEVFKSLDIGEHDLLNEVKDDNPPLFMFLCQADSTVPANESMMLGSIYAQKKLPFEMHCYVAGDHGLSLGTKESGVVNKDYATWFNHSLSFLNNIQRDTPLILGDIEEDLNDISIESRIGALMYNKEAWTVIEEMLPDIAFKAKTDSIMQSRPLQRIWRRGIIKEPSEKEVDERLRKMNKKGE